MDTVNAVDVIRAKRDGARLRDDEIDWVLGAYTRGEVADEQMAALAMAILLNGMDDVETARWTRAMIDSGERLHWPDLGRPTVDKHSTGGVGDKVTLALAPLVATCGAAVPHLAGRGLGHTGGTLDKLEAIPGWRATLPFDEMTRQLTEVGAMICAPTARLVPADRKLYALRDVTGTVESIPLIASSIMSKKLAAGAGALVLDVKVGSGAFLPDRASAARLAALMVRIGDAYGVAASALLTDMSAPLGSAVGNALEVAEAVEVLRGGGPADVVEVTVALAAEMLAAAGVTGADPAAVLASGAAHETWCRMIRAQGGDPEAALPRAAHREQVPAAGDGTVLAVDARAVGVAAWRLGAGRERKEQAVSPAAGVRCLLRPGEAVVAGQPVFELHTDRPDTVPTALDALRAAVRIGPGPDAGPVPDPAAGAPGCAGRVLDVLR